MKSVLEPLVQDHPTGKIINSRTFDPRLSLKTFWKQWQGHHERWNTMFVYNNVSAKSNWSSSSSRSESPQNDVWLYTKRIEF